MEFFNKKQRYFYLFMYCILCPVLLQGQSMYAVNYTFKDGLPSDEVYWVKEGSDGTMGRL